jgi:hypothetical protein
MALSCNRQQKQATGVLDKSVQPNPNEDRAR